MLKMDKIAITTTSFAEYDQACLKMLDRAGYKLIFNHYKRKLTPEEFVVLVKDCVGVIAGTELINQQAIDSLPSLRVISRCGSGIDNIDLKAANKRKIKIYNTPDAPALAVAELTVGLILGILRKIAQMDNETKRGIWRKRMGQLLSGKKVGIIGFGRIGKKVAQLLGAFGVEIGYYDPYVKSIDKRKFSKLKLLQWADIITLHLSSDKTILGKNELKKMKQGAYLVNVSRGNVVDTDALYDALKKAHLSAAALDVFPNEPYKGKLLKLENIILTPHIGSYAREARVKMEEECVMNLIMGLKEEG